MNETIKTLDEATLAKLSAVTGELQQQVSHALVGQEEVLQQLCARCWPAAMCCSKACPGLGKTLLVRSARRSARPATSRASSSPRT